MSSQNTRKNKHKFAKEEIMLTLRCYQVHPASFSDIVTEIKENVDVLSPYVKEMYNTLSHEKLVQRVREKFQRLMQNAQNETDLEIIEELNAIKKTESENIPVSSTNGVHESLEQEADDNNTDEDDDVRHIWAREIARKIEEVPSDRQKWKRKKSKSEKAKKRYTRDLIRENELIKTVLLRDYLKRKRKKKSLPSSSSLCDPTGKHKKEVQVL